MGNMFNVKYITYIINPHKMPSHNTAPCAMNICNKDVNEFVELMTIAVN